MAELTRESKVLIHALGVVANSVGWDPVAIEALEVVRQINPRGSTPLQQVARDILVARPVSAKAPPDGMDWAVAIMALQRVLVGYHRRAMADALGSNP